MSPCLWQLSDENIKLILNFSFDILMYYYYYCTAIASSCDESFGWLLVEILEVPLNDALHYIQSKYAHSYLWHRIMNQFLLCSVIIFLMHCAIRTSRIIVILCVLSCSYSSCHFSLHSTSWWFAWFSSVQFSLVWCSLEIRFYSFLLLRHFYRWQNFWFRMLLFCIAHKMKCHTNVTDFAAVDMST